MSTDVFKLGPLVIANLACMMALMAFVAVVGSLARLLGLAEWHAGMAVTVAGVLWFLSARPLGGLSDRVGRKRVMTLSVAGFALAYLLLTTGLHYALESPPVWWVSFGLMMLGRGAMGVCYAGFMPSAHASIADHVASNQRAGAMAALGAAGAAGMVLGPALAGLLSRYGLSFSLLATAVLPFIACSILIWRLPAGLGRNPRQRPPPRMTDSRLRLPISIAFVAMFSVSVAQITVGFFAMDRLELDAAAGAKAAGLALTAVGVALILAQLNVRRLGWPPYRLIVVGMLIAAVGFGACVLVQTTWHLMAAFFVAASGMGMVFPAMSAAAANAVEAHEQGIAAGTVSSVQALGVVAGPLAGSLLYGWSPLIPYGLIAALLFATALLVRQVVRRDREAGTVGV